MKSEAEIREAMYLLERVIALAPDTGTEGEFVMRSHIELLRWILGEGSERIDELHKEIRAHLTAMN